MIPIGACYCLFCLSRICEPGEGGPGAEHSALQSSTYTSGLPSTQAGDLRTPVLGLVALCLRAAADVPYIRPAAVVSTASTAIRSGICFLRSSTLLSRIPNLPQRLACCYAVRKCFAMSLPLPGRLPVDNSCYGAQMVPSLLTGSLQHQGFLWWLCIIAQSVSDSKVCGRHCTSASATLIEWSGNS